MTNPPAPQAGPEDHWSILPAPRVPPMPSAQQSWVMRSMLRLVRLKTDVPGKSSQVLNIFGMLAYVPHLFYRGLIFGSGLMPGGKLPRLDSERVILRVGHQTGSWYEWVQHVRLGQEAGLTLAEIDTIRYADHPSWTPRTRALLHSTDGLIKHHNLSDAQWRTLREHLSDALCIEFSLLVGHYVMVAMMLNSMGVPTEPQFADDLRNTPGADHLPRP